MKRDFYDSQLLEIQRREISEMESLRMALLSFTAGSLITAAWLT
jgi:hypothetical protein